MYLNDFSGLVDNQPVGVALTDVTTDNTVNIRLTPSVWSLPTEASTADNDSPIVINQFVTSSGTTISYPAWTTEAAVRAAVDRAEQEDRLRAATSELLQQVRLPQTAENTRRELRAEGATRQDVENLLGESVDPVEEYLQERMRDDDEG